MAENIEPKSGVDAENPSTETKQPPVKSAPQSAELVGNEHGKKIRELQTKLSESENRMGLLGRELEELRGLLKTAADTPVTAITTTEKGESILDRISALYNKTMFGED